MRLRLKAKNNNTYIPKPQRLNLHPAFGQMQTPELSYKPELETAVIGLGTEDPLDRQLGIRLDGFHDERRTYVGEVDFAN